ncbi:MAG: futalosine hydrolase [Ferruginibacter sp.]
MEILVVAATLMEIAAFTEQSTGTDILITGVGSPACMYALTKQLQRKNYDIVIQAGIAGTFSSIYPPGNTVTVKQDVFADLGIFEQDLFSTLFEKGFAEKNAGAYTEGVLLNPYERELDLPQVNAITVNTVSDKPAQASLFQKKYDADIETMEGASFQYVCISEGIPFIQLRSISNFVGERVRTNWKIKEAVLSLNENLQRIVEQLKKGM